MNDKPDKPVRVSPLVVEIMNESRHRYAESLMGRVDKLLKLEATIARDSDEIEGKGQVAPPGYSVSDDICAEAIVVMQSVKKEVKAICDRIEVGLIFRILVLGEFTVGDDRYYVGREKRVKCRNPRDVLDRILDSADGDLDRVIECLSANEFKPGETRKAIGDIGYDACFEESFQPDLQTGKPRQVLKSSNPKFQK